MRVNCRMFALLALLASPAFGAGQVWLTAVPITGNASIVFQGPGQALGASGFGNLNVSVHFRLDDGGATGWALDLYGNNNCISISDLNVVSQGFPIGINTGSVVNAGGVLIQDQNGQTLTPGGTGPGEFILETFTLIDHGCAGYIYAGIGAAEFGGNDPDGFGFYEMVQIGPNPYRPGYSLGGGDPTGAEPLPVLVTHVPEPASAIGFIFLIASPRRRTRTMSKSKW